ncbi:MAG: phosphoribosylformylglycinamidine synthase subunit PurL [Thaumarchaeota archaeon]|nr:phosphoribosylformylglycinamidine synthase subunit PurL [Nitrososphaerota archaeon]
MAQSLKLVSVDDKKAFQLCRKLGTGLSFQEVSAVRAYFKKIGRDPTEIELQTIAQTWSEHCFHKVFKSKIRFGSQTINGLFNSFIKRATQEIAPSWVISAFSDNAGIIKFEETLSIAAKVETHNHPSAIEPFGGAATGVGGVIRDILGVWAEPIANTDMLFFGHLDFPYKRLPAGIMHARYLLSGVVSGVGAYGNNMGIPTVNGGVYFDESFTGYTLVFCGCIGLLKNRNYARNAKSGDVLVIAGGRTGKDGIHGVNFASEKIEGDPDALRPAVQIPNPITEEKLARAVIEIGNKRLASAITDLGGGGLSSGVCELAKSFGCGAEVDLASIPLKTSDLEPWEIWISESQERMLLVVPEQTLSKTLSIFESEEIEASAIGALTASGQVVLRNRDTELGRLDLQFLFSPPLPKLETKKYGFANGKRNSEVSPHFKATNLQEDVLSLLGSPNIASKEGIVRTYDFEVKGNTVIKPFQYPRSGPNDAAVLKPVRNSEKGLAISCGFNPRLSAIDPYWMAVASIDEALRNNIAVGGRRIALLDNFAWGDPEDQRNLWALVRASQACYVVSKAFEAPFISGKDSLYNQTPIGEILPTLVITALGIVPEISGCVTADFKRPGDSIFLVGETHQELGGSEFYKLKGVSGGSVPKIDLLKAPSRYKGMNRAMDQRIVRACHDLSQGGLIVALAEMCFANGFGADITIENASSEIQILSELFSESNSRFLVEVRSEDLDKFEKTMKEFPTAKLGTIQERGIIAVKGPKGRRLLDVPVDECYASWTKRFSNNVGG